LKLQLREQSIQDTRSLGIFVPYRAKADTSAYREMIQSQMHYLNQLAVIPIWGLYQDVLSSKMHYLNQLAVIPIWGLYQDVLSSKTRCQQTGEDTTLLKKLLDATHEARESDGRMVTSYSLGNVEKTRQKDTHGKWFVMTTKSTKTATCLLLDHVLIKQGNLTPEHQVHAAGRAPYAQGIHSQAGNTE
jgi:hypothetical protein